MNKIVLIYKYIFARKLFYPIHRLMFSLSTRGLGILNYENSTLSGEKFFLKKIASSHYWKEFTCIDVGANIGDYSQAVIKLIDSANVHAIEPHPKAFLKLDKNSRKLGYIAHNLAFSKSSSELSIFDCSSFNSDNYSVHTSLYKEAVLQEYNESEVQEYKVNAITLDDFLADENINKVSLLKIDVEGHEFDVLLGAHKALNLNKIDIIQFEFNSMNRLSRVYMKDFFELLDNYRLYRLMQDFMIPLAIDNALILELFAYQNIVAVRKDIHLN